MSHRAVGGSGADAAGSSTAASSAGSPASRLSLAQSIADEALRSLPEDVSRRDLERSVERALRGEARKRETSIALVRGGVLSLALTWALAVVLAGGGAASLDGAVTILLALWTAGAWLLYRSLTGGTYPGWMRIVLPLTDAALLAGLFALAATRPPSPEMVAFAGASAVLLAFLGPVRLSRSSTRVSTLASIALWVFAAALSDVPAATLLGVGLLILSGTWLSVKMMAGVRRLIAEQVRSSRLRNLYEVAQEGLDARQQVLGVVCHDLRNPLTSIASTAGLLLEVPLKEEEWRAHLRVIERVSRHMDRLIHDLLDVARIESGSVGVDPRPCPVRAILESMDELMRPVAEAADVDLIVRDGGEVQEVMADAERVQQVLSNLVGNAVKFTPAGGRVVVEAARAGPRARVSVRDTGPGIPPDELAHLWKRLWQAEPGDRRGLGLGLTIARAIVEAHGESIGVESSVGEGSTFWFTLALPEPQVPS